MLRKYDHILYNGIPHKIYDISRSNESEERPQIRLHLKAPKKDNAFIMFNKQRNINDYDTQFAVKVFPKENEIEYPVVIEH
jgi:hypothetical protein